MPLCFSFLSCSCSEREALGAGVSPARLCSPNLLTLSPAASLPKVSTVFPNTYIFSMKIPLNIPLLPKNLAPFYHNTNLTFTGGYWLPCGSYKRVRSRPFLVPEGKGCRAGGRAPYYCCYCWWYFLAPNFHFQITIPLVFGKTSPRLTLYNPVSFLCFCGILPEFQERSEELPRVFS